MKLGFWKAAQKDLRNHLIKMGFLQWGKWLSEGSSTAYLWISKFLGNTLFSFAIMLTKF